MQPLQRPEDRVAEGLSEHHGETLTGRVSLDGGSFQDCRFKNATLVYSGAGGAELSGCAFDGVKFEFVGPAANTLALLKAMAAPRSGLSSVVRASFPQLFSH